MIAQAEQEIITIAEGLWISPGQPERKMKFVAVRKSSDHIDYMVIFNDTAENRRSPHGAHALIPVNEDGAALSIVFHSSSVACWKMVSKYLYPMGFAVWQDYNYKEKFVLTNIPIESPIANRFQQNVTPLYNTDEMVDAITTLARKAENGSSDASMYMWQSQETKLVLRWCHPGQSHSFILCQHNEAIVFLRKDGGVTREHGYWSYIETEDAFLTHFHHEGECDDDGSPSVPPTYLKRVGTNLAQCYLATGGDWVSNGSNKRIRVYGPDEQNKVRKWHIFATIVWRAN